MQYVLCIKVAASACGLHLHADEKPWLSAVFVNARDGIRLAPHLHQ
jgi:hypothetical protein